MARKVYQIIRESAYEREVLSTATTKRKIETEFSSWLRIFRSSALSVTLHNMGYATVTYSRSFSLEEVEVYISCAPAVPAAPTLF